MRYVRIDAQSVAVIPLNSEDILALRRVIRVGDTVSGSTTWVLKRDREYSRPDKGERIRVLMAIRVVSISLDHTLDRIRISGTILETDNDAIPGGMRHSLGINVGDRLRITKKKWQRLDRKTLKRANPNGFVLVAADRRECGVARLLGTHVHYLPDIHSGSGGKRYASRPYLSGYLEDVTRAIHSVRQTDDSLILFGPGTTKRRLANHITERYPKLKPTVTEGVDSGGQDGIHLFVRSESLQQAASDSRLAQVSRILDDVMSMASRTSGRFTTGYAQTRSACDMGAIKSLVYSDGLFGHASEDDIVDTLNRAEASGAKIYSADSSTDLGLRVTGMGGIVSILRYAVS